MTDWTTLVAPALTELEFDPFDIGGVAETKARHGLEEVLKLHWNENLFGPLPAVLEAVQEELANVWMYPEEAYADFRADVAAVLGTSPRRIFPGHGTQALIGVLATALLRPGDHVVVPSLTYYLYGRVCSARGVTVHPVPLRELRIDLDALLETARETRARVIWICDPNNPTGDVLEREEWAAFHEALPDECVAVVDEAYVDYLPLARRVPRLRDIEAGRPLVVLRSFSKFFGLAGLRLGYAVADEALVSYLARVEEPYNVNSAALAAGRACLRADEAAEERRLEVAAGRGALFRGLQDAGLEPLTSEANFVMAQVDVDDAALAEGLAARGILIRPGTDFGLPGYVRITVGPSLLMERVTAEIRDVCAALRR